MATADHDSSLDLVSTPQGDSAGSESGLARPEIWLDGDVLACACPDCGAPMSIRLWLMVADCWRCGASIELTEEQEQEALRLLRQREAEQRTDAQETREAMAAIQPSALRKPKPHPASQPPPSTPPPSAPPQPEQRPETPPEEPQRASSRPSSRPPPLRRRPAAAQLRHAVRRRLRESREKGAWRLLLRDLLRNLPAWLISMVLHIVAMLLLGLWMIGPKEEDLTITLATTVSFQEIEGGLLAPEPDEQAFEFDDPGEMELFQPSAMPSSGVTPDMGEVALRVPDPIGSLPQLAKLGTAVPPARMGTMFSGRDPTLRAQIVRKEGGTSFTEAAVARGLKWLARYQNEDGSWSLDRFQRAPKATGRETGQGQTSDTAGTALALLPFLGAGQTHEQGEYSEVVSKGLQWLVDHQGSDGDLRGRGVGRMYAHGQAAIALSEAYALSGDERLREPAQRALDFIVRAQHPAGGWRYEPGQAGDTSVLGWQLMALRSGTMAYLIVPQKTFDASRRFLDDVACNAKGSEYSYMPGGGVSHRMTAEALLCRQYLGWPRNRPGLLAGVNFLLDRHPPNIHQPDIYYWYYATQVMHHMGGSNWERWNRRMRSVLVDMQETREPHAGSWAPQGEFSREGGRIFMTSLAICTLEVYYRHLPLYQEDVLHGLEQQ